MENQQTFKLFMKYIKLTTQQAVIQHYKNCLLGAVTLTKNADIDKNKYSGYSTGFDRKGSFSFPGTGLGNEM